MWVAWGLPSEDFWEQIPSTFNAIIKGKRRQSETNLQNAIAAQWFGEFMAREKKLKKPSHYVAMMKPRTKQTGQDVLALFKGWQAAGVPINIRKVGE